jgi:D-alanyl-D-alanine carboxypeptidase/D-alanyl-D-alanine-endopeptidase (penicillin-binding protein 4)
MMIRVVFLLFLALQITQPLAAAGPAARIRAFLDASPVARTAFWGVQIVDLDQHRVLFDLNPNRLFLPASNAKLFTAALALMRLGPDYRFQTRVLADRAPDQDGCIASLRLVGGGDPNLSGRAIPYRQSIAPAADPLLAVEDLARQVVARGVRCVDGDVVGDDTAYVWEPYPDGWSMDDGVWDYGAAVSALSINDNTLTVTVLPGDDAARILVTPPLDYYEIDNRARTVRPVGGKLIARKIVVDRLPGSRQLRIWGTLPPNDPGEIATLGIDDPALYAAYALRDRLAGHGIAIRGEARARHLFPNQVADLEKGPAPEPEAGVELASRESAPLVEDLRITAKVSQNLHAEMALRAVARALRRIGSREAGLAEMRTFLEEVGIGRGSYTFADGSGLSRLDLVSPAAVAALLAYVYRSAARDQWLSLLPIGGQDGTLHARFAGSRAAGRIRAKTGSLSHVSALAGYAQRGNGQMLAFSILVNNYNGPAADLTAAIDRICELMVE